MSQYDSDEEEQLYESDSEASFDDAIVGSGSQAISGGRGTGGEEYPYTVLSTEQVTSLMVDTIKEVNLVVQVRLFRKEENGSSHQLIILRQLPQTTTRILLNHFHWDKEKLYEKYYAEEDQEALFAEAHVINPNSAANKSKGVSGVKKRRTRGPAVKVDCLICYLDYSVHVCPQRSFSLSPPKTNNKQTLSAHTHTGHGDHHLWAHLLQGLLGDLPDDQDHGGGAGALD